MSDCETGAKLRLLAGLLEDELRRAGLVGARMDSKGLAAVQRVASDLLSGLREQDVIRGDWGVRVSVASDDPGCVQVQFQPPLDYVKLNLEDK